MGPFLVEGIELRRVAQRPVGPDHFVQRASLSLQPRLEIAQALPRLFLDAAGDDLFGSGIDGPDRRNVDHTPGRYRPAAQQGRRKRLSLPRSESRLAGAGAVRTQRVFRRDAELARGQCDAAFLELRHERGPDPGRLQTTQDLPVDEVGLLELEDVLGLDLVFFDPVDLGDVDDPAAAVLEPGCVDDEVHRRSDLLPDRPQRQLVAGHQDHRLDAREHVARRVCVARGERSVVARVHRLEHVQGLASSALADDDAVRAHVQGVADQQANRDLAFALQVCRPRLEGDHVLLTQLELGRVLDGDDPLVVGDER